MAIIRTGRAIPTEVMSSSCLSSYLDSTTKLIPINKQADNDIVHLRGLREADCFPRQALNSGAQD